MAFKSDQTSSAVCSPAVLSWIGEAGGWEDAGRNVARWEPRQLSSAQGNRAWAPPRALQVPAHEPFCAPPALFPRPHWHPQPGAGGSHGRQLPGDTTFTDCRLINPTGPALDRRVCAPLQSDQSHFPTRFLLLGINQSKKAAWADHCPGAFCYIHQLIIVPYS